MDLLPSVEPVSIEALSEERFERAVASQQPGYAPGSAQWMAPEVERFTGIVESYDYDEQTGAIHWTRTQDISAILDDNHEHRAGNYDGWRKKEDKWVAMASIPNVVIEETMRVEGWSVYDARTDRNGVPNDQMRKLLKKLRSDWKYFKKHDMDFGDGKGMGNTRLASVPGNGLIWGKRHEL